MIPNEKELLFFILFSSTVLIMTRWNLAQVYGSNWAYLFLYCQWCDLVSDTKGWNWIGLSPIFPLPVNINTYCESLGPTLISGYCEYDMLQEHISEINRLILYCLSRRCYGLKAKVIMGRNLRVPISCRENIAGCETFPSAPLRFVF